MKIPRLFKLELLTRLGTNYFVNFFRDVCNRQNTQKQLDTVSLNLQGKSYPMNNVHIIDGCSFYSY
jgi:hypothetical protein